MTSQKYLKENAGPPKISVVNQHNLMCKSRRATCGALLASAFCGAEASAARRLLPNRLAHQRFFFFFLKSEQFFFSKSEQKFKQI
jgi:hypothetical protein